ncbi:MAG: efflux RND transporter periplasmic adaptor subunit, partial [Actinomycetia bacterium]|nr:efflux RND transporter periplasmic adaptor subunit [Actinomycetes bacterium]
GKVAAEQKVNVGTILPGRVSEVLVKEGDRVGAGDPLFSLESDDLVIAVDQARINLRISELNEKNARSARNIAQKSLDKLRAGATSEEIAISTATLSQYQAGIDAAEQGLEDIEDLNDSSVEIAELAVEQAESAIDAAEQALEDAEDAWDAAQVTSPSLPDLELLTFEAVLHQAEANLEAAELGLESAELALDMAETLSKQALNGAEAQVETAEKTYGLGESQYNLTKAGATKYDEDIFVEQLNQGKSNYSSAIRQTELARLNLEGAELQLNKTTVNAPMPGLVAEINVKKGEIISSGIPGTPPLAVIIDIDSLKFKTSVDETDITLVETEQKAKIEMDSYPEKVFKGTIEKLGITPV